MAIGERIHFFRLLRGMTQKYLGMALGFPEKSADVRDVYKRQVLHWYCARFTTKNASLRKKKRRIAPPLPLSLWAAQAAPAASRF